MSARLPTVIGADAILLSELFDSGRFAVPWHQRYYDWTPTNTHELLLDLDEAIKEGRRCHFLGAILLVETAEGRWEINDGQQRMVTVSLIAAALCRRFARETGDSQREGQALRMIFDLDDRGVWSLKNAEHYEPRIQTPVGDRMRYRQMIRGNSIGSNGKLTETWRTIEEFLGPTNTGERWEHYFDFLRKQLEIACLRVPRDLDPNAVYETINSRGKQLDDLDRIRNFLYSYFNAESEAQRKDTVHTDLERIREVFPSIGRAENYMRCRLQCRFGFLPKDNLYREVRLAIREQRNGLSSPPLSPADYAFGLPREIAKPEDLELFRRLTAATPDQEFVRAFEAASGTVNSPRNLTVFLRELSSYTITQCLVFALMVKYIRQTDGRRRRRIARGVHRSISRLVTFVLRTAFVAPKFEPSHFETEFSNFARDIATATEISDDHFVRFLQDCDRSEYGVLDDAKFLSEISETTLSGKKRTCHFLLGINRHGRPDAVVLSPADCTVEHIFPQSSEHWNDWHGFDNVDGKDWVNRIGNLTLMSSGDNKPGRKFNSSFAKKREGYKNSSVAMTRELASDANWTPQSIEKRQQRMAETAVQVWAWD